MKKLLLNSLLGLTLLSSGCKTFKGGFEEPPAVTLTPLATTLNKLPTLDGKPIYIGVNSFKDLTGQRKQSDNYASFS